MRSEKSDATLKPGETIGRTEDEKLPITLSEGWAIEGETLKIGFLKNEQEQTTCE